MGRRGVRPERSIFEALLEQTRVTNCLLAAQLRLHMTQMEVVALLQKTGLTAKEIGEMLGTSSAVVSVTQMRIRKRSIHKEQTHGEAENPEVAQDGVREGRDGE